MTSLNERMDAIEERQRSFLELVSRLRSDMKAWDENFMHLSVSLVSDPTMCPCHPIADDRKGMATGSSLVDTREVIRLPGPHSSR